MVSKLTSTQRLLLAAEGFERGDDADLVEVALGRLLVEPAEELCHRDAVDAVRLAHAGDLGVVLRRLGHQHRVALFDDDRVADALDGIHDRDRGGGGIEQHALVGGAELAERGGQGGGVGELGDAR